MRVEGTHSFDAPRDVVWPMILDPEVLAKTLPGCEHLEQVGDNEFEGTMKIKIGPVQGTFDGKITLSDVVEPKSATISVSGEGAPGFVTGTGNLTLTDDGDTTGLTYEGDAQIGGRLAAVGQRLLDSSTRAIIAAGLDALDVHIQATQAATESAVEGDSDQPVAAPNPPSQAEFAMDVGRRMIRDALGGDNPDATRKRLRAAQLILLAYCLRRWCGRRHR